jgi:hypothetical protein
MLAPLSGGEVQVLVFCDVLFAFRHEWMIAAHGGSALPWFPKSAAGLVSSLSGD